MFFGMYTIFKQINIMCQRMTRKRLETLGPGIHCNLCWSRSVLTFKGLRKNDIRMAKYFWKSWSKEQFVHNSQNDTMLLRGNGALTCTRDAFSSFVRTVFYYKRKEFALEAQYFPFTIDRHRWGLVNTKANRKSRKLSLLSKNGRKSTKCIHSP